MDQINETERKRVREKQESLCKAHILRLDNLFTNAARPLTFDPSCLPHWSYPPTPGRTFIRPCVLLACCAVSIKFA